MERDGFCESLWQANKDNFSATTQGLTGQVDVIIVGGGITGLTTGLQLLKAGKSCAILEAKNIGFGTTGGSSAHLNTLMDDPYYQIAKDFGKEAAEMVANITRNAIELIKRNSEEYDINCDFKEVPAYLFSQSEDENKELGDILKGLKDVDIEADYTEHVPTPVPFINAVKVGAHAQFHPVKYIYGLAKAFEAAGGKLYQHCRLNAIKEGDGIVTAETTLGEIKGSALIYATHIPPGVNVLHFTCAPYRSYVMAFKLKDDNYPNALIYDLKDPYHYYRTYEENGEKLLVAGGEDHKTAHQENTEVCFAKLESYIRKFYDVEEVKYKWSSQYFEPADGLPYIGELPGNPSNVYVATGFGGNGLIYGTASALILTDLIVSGKSDYKALFNPKRIKPITGFANVVKEGADVVANLISRRLSIEKIEEMAQLAKGEAKVVSYEGNSVALYKDDSGKLYAVNPSCPHISCVVGWNTAEKSWDCPCHGSRFSFTGELLTGPSQKDLAVIDLTK